MNKLDSKQLELLNKQLPNEAVSPHPTKPYLSTIKAIYVVERLNDVFGLGGWFINNEVIEAKEKNIVVKSTFQAPEYGILIPDIFGGNDNPDRGDAFKGACTDALTKIGSYLGIGMDVFKGLHDKKVDGGNKVQQMKEDGERLRKTFSEKKEVKMIEQKDGKAPFVETVEKLGKEIDLMTGKPYYDKILKKEAESIKQTWKSAADIQTILSKKDFHAQLSGFKELVLSLLRPFAFADDKGAVIQFEKVTDLGKEEQDKIYKQLDLVSNI